MHSFTYRYDWSYELNSTNLIQISQRDLSVHVINFLICIVGGGSKVHSTLRPLNGLLCQARVIMIMDKSVEWLAGETEVLGENLPQCRFVHHKPHMLPVRSVHVSAIYKFSSYLTGNTARLGYKDELNAVCYENYLEHTNTFCVQTAVLVCHRTWCAQLPQDFKRLKQLHLTCSCRF
jgi:hypothetical protein